MTMILQLGRSLRAKRYLSAIFVSLLVIGGIAVGQMWADVQPAYLYNLSGFNGPVHLNWGQIGIDQTRDEIYVTDPKTGAIIIFNDKGMEIHRFGEDGSLGAVSGVAVNDSGQILLLTQIDAKPAILICDYKGQPVSKLTLKNLPPEFSAFSAERIVIRHERIYLLDQGALLIVVTDEEGVFQFGYDIGRLLAVSEKKRLATQISGFSVDGEKNILFTIPVLFTAYKLTPEGKIFSFGRPGSAPGRFGVVGGIVADDEGNLYVADRLKSVILIFDKNFNFQMEFGYRGNKSNNLIGPKDLGLDSHHRLYISQLNSRGVSVFKLNYK
ncbi:MAG: hypothetical protein M0036_08940 [Desulfobacteraceae bacterium]|nr:hypothetical protein [Desulfobacteraceae bacterium]